MAEVEKDSSVETADMVPNIVEAPIIEDAKNFYPSPHAMATAELEDVNVPEAPAVETAPTALNEEEGETVSGYKKKLTEDIEKLNLFMHQNNAEDKKKPHI